MRARDLRLAPLTGPGDEGPLARGSAAGGGFPLARTVGLRHLPLISPVSGRPPTRMEKPVRSQVPFLNRRHTRRPRLTRLLDASSAQSIILSGPPGYGKTSLAAEWLEHHPSVAWYRATSGSADLAAFSTGLADVMAPLVPGAGHRLRQRLRVSEPPADAVRPVAELLADDLSDWPDGSWLVIDDYHLLADSTPVEEFMDWLLMLAPRLRVLATSRRRPAWATARRILYGEVTEITADQLAMTTDEAVRLLDGHSTEAARALVAQADGWPALLGLAALCSSAEVPTERVSDELYRYFADEVFSRQPPEIQQFMLVSSVGSTIDPRTATEVLGLGDASGIIGRLEEEGLLTRGSPEQSFHPLLRAFLRHRLETEKPGLARSVGERLVDHSRTNGLWQEAFDVAVRMEWFERAAEVVGQASAELLAAGQLETLEKWLTLCGAAVPNCPEALLARAEVLLRTGRVTEAGSLAQSLAEDLADEDHASQAWCLAGKAMHLTSDEHRALEYHQRAIECARSDSERSESFWGAFLAAGELELPDADEYLAKFRRQCSGDVDARLRIATGTALHNRNVGLLEAIKIGRGVLPLVEYARDPIAKVTFLTIFSYLQCLRGQYATALTTVAEAERTTDDMRLTFASAFLAAVRGLAEIGLRDFTDAARALGHLERAARELEDPWLLVSSQILSIKLALSRGSAILRLDASIPAVNRVSPNLRGELLAVKALALTTIGEHDKALGLARSVPQLTTSFEARRLGEFAELVIEVETGQEFEIAETAAVKLILKSLEEEILDPALLALRTSYRVLNALSASSKTRSLVEEVIIRTGDSQLATEIGLPTAGSGGLLEQLTPREREVLALLTRGLSNREMAKTLVVEESTIKAHMHHVFTKLGARSRIQAILIAQAEETKSAVSGSTSLD